MWKSPIVILSLLLVASAIQVPIVVKDTSKYGSTNFPTSVVIPVPYGKYQSTDSFRLTDSSQTTIPCQFNVQTRWTAKDNSIREVVAHFHATVSPYTTAGTGTATYYFSDDGNGNVAPANSITVTDNNGAWTISNGLISMQVNKNSFTTISSLSLNGNPMLTSTGGILVDPKGNLQVDSALPVYSAEIEESGPMRVVVKVTASSKFTCVVINETGCKFPMQHCAPGQDVQVQHGFAVRIYAYAGQSFVKIDYQLRNSPFSALVNGYALYFDEVRIDYALSLSSTSTVTIGKGDGTAWTGQISSTGTQLYQDFPIYTNNVYRIRDASSLSNQFTGNISNGFVDVSDNNGGVMAFIRNFWQSWPNGITVQLNNSQIRMSVELYPKGGVMLNYKGISDPSDLYWLDDMQHVYKEYYIYAHGKITPEQMISMTANFQWFPVPVLPASWYRNTSATLDLGGVIPEQPELTNSDTDRTPLKDQLKWINTPTSAINSSKYNFHWRHFGSHDPGYRDTSCTTGGYPYSVSAFLMTGNPKDYFDALDKGMGELNTRPQWMSPESYKTNWTMPYNNPGPYCGVSWRYWCSDRVQTAAPWMNVTRQRIINPRDDEHGWFYHALESYSITGNLWIKDWYTFVQEFRKTRLYQNSVLYPDRSSRAIGHSLNHAVQAFRVTGDSTFVKDFHYHIVNFRKPAIDPRFGCQTAGVEASGGGYQTGFFMRALIDYMEEISDPQAWADTFQVLSALVSWNQNIGHFPYYFQPANYPNNGQYTGASSGTSSMLVDPVAWYYYHTGWEQYKDIILQFSATGIPGQNGTNVINGTKSYYNFASTWTGDFHGRVAKGLFSNKTMSHDTRPAKIDDLAVYVNGTTIRLLWTTPANAVKFHFVYSTAPISENHITVNSTIAINWWAANAVGSIIPAVPGQQQTIAIETNKTGDYFAAMFTWDAIGNMSPMSNLASNTNATFPTGITTTTGMTTDSSTSGQSTTDSASSGQSTAESKVSFALYVKPSLLILFVLLFLTLNQ